MLLPFIILSAGNWFSIEGKELFVENLVVTKSSLDAVEKGKISCLCRELNTDS
jgi:hypothetical protein